MHTVLREAERPERARQAPRRVAEAVAREVEAPQVRELAQGRAELLLRRVAAAEVEAHERERAHRHLGSKRVVQRRFNLSVPRARVPGKAPTLRGRSER